MSIELGTYTQGEYKPRPIIPRARLGSTAIYFSSAEHAQPTPSPSELPKKVEKSSIAAEPEPVVKKPFKRIRNKEEIDRAIKSFKRRARHKKRTGIR